MTTTSTTTLALTANDPNFKQCEIPGHALDLRGVCILSAAPALINQEEAAELCGLHRMCYSDIERGERKRLPCERRED